MLSLSRLAVTASVAAALAVPAAAQARPDAGGIHWDDQVPASIDKASADARFVPHPDATFVSAPKTACPRPWSSRPTTASSGATPPSAAAPRCC